MASRDKSQYHWTNYYGNYKGEKIKGEDFLNIIIRNNLPSEEIDKLVNDFVGDCKHINMKNPFFTPKRFALLRKQDIYNSIKEKDKSFISDGFIKVKSQVKTLWEEYNMTKDRN